MGRVFVLSMPGCTFNVSGTNIDVEACLAASSLCEFATVYHRGEPTPSTVKPIYERSGFSLYVSDQDEDELEPQISDALEFLQEERSELERLAAFPGVEEMEFRIGLFWWSHTLMQFHSLPPEFLRLAGELGVAVTLCIYGAARDQHPETAERTAEPGAAPNGGPAARLDNSGVSEGPPSVI